MYKTKKKVFSIIVFISIVAVALGCYSLFVGRLTFSTIASSDEVWDGVTASTLFPGGNGTQENPYQIRNGADLLYFKNLIESDTLNVYKNKYYILTKNIDMGEHSFTTIGTKDNFFQGHFDGNGYTIINLKINGYNTIDFVDYYSLFSKTESATIENINFYNYSITTNISDNPIKTGSLIGDALATKVSNISFQNSSFDFTNISNTNYIGGIVNCLDKDSSLENIATSFSVKSSNTFSIGSIAYSVNTAVNPAISNVITNMNYDNLLIANHSFYLQKDSDIITNHIYDYTVNDGIKFSDDTMDTDKILSLFNTDNKYKWLVEEQIFKFEKSNTSNESVITNQVSSSGLRVASIPLHDSSISGDSVYINDLDADYNYYKGLNYTYSENDGVMPTLENQNLYKNTNLVKVYIHYSGTDINDNSKVGYVSLDEQQSNYVYYKYYPVVNNSVSFDLIDNPFTDRPNNMAFNGWVTDYSSALISYDDSYYTRKVSIPVTYTNGIPNDIQIDFHASWIPATKVELTSSSDWSNAFSQLKTKSMEKLNTSNLIGQSAAGYFKAKTISNGTSSAGLYNATGQYQNGGNCSISSGCTYYELLQYYDNSGNVQVINNDESYYYLATRDTNIVVMKNNINKTWSSEENKPFTFTSVYNDVDYRNDYSWDVSNLSIKCFADTTIENIKIKNSKSVSEEDVLIDSDLSNINYLYGNWNNVKIGRGTISDNSQNVTFNNILGGGNDSTGSLNNITKYKFIVESGIYNSGSLTQGNIQNNATDYVEAKGIYGSDYDRISNNNDNLIFYSSLAGSWGGKIYATTDYSIALDSTYKSGQYGKNKASDTAGIYIGGRTGGTHYAARRGTIEGGWFFNVIGGSATDSSRRNTNDLYLYIKGGQATVIHGGTDSDSTYGNRIIQMTGGTVSNSLFGGSNAYDSTDGSGILKGSSLVYVGGNSIIGADSYIENKITYYQVESGSIFGNGNGNSSSSSIGSNDNANIIIADNALIKGNVYGGGNYGATGVESNSDTNTTNIQMLGGTIEGSLYGGGNNNGAGSTTKNSIINIKVTEGTINGSLYGGSKNKGTIYGDINLEVLGGTIKDSVYGGGEGGYESDSSKGTFVSGNIKLTIGNSDSSVIPTINGSLYGGSAYGTVNGLENTTSVSDKSVSITVNKGLISEAIYGGGKGSSLYSPYVLGSINLIVNDVNAGNLFGGNNVSGMVNGDITVNLMGGTFGNVYGGGNKAPINKSSVYVYGDTVTMNDLFGGSNEGAIAKDTNLYVKRGNINNIYGGNSQGGSTTTSHVTVFSEEIYSHVYQATINGIIYGGGKASDTTTSNVTLQDLDASTVYGGGENASVKNANITSISSTVENIYGGSNLDGNVDCSNITINKGVYGNVYGGNHQGGTTKVTNISHKGGTTTNLYGGGNHTSSEKTNVIVVDGIVANLYGGGNQAGVDETNVNILSGSVFNAYGGSNQSGTVKTTNIQTNGNDEVNDSDIDFNVSYIAEDTTWQSSEYPTIVTIDYKITNNSNTTLSTWNASIYAEKSTMFSNYSSSEITENDSFYSINEVNRWYGTNPIAPGQSYTISFAILTMQSKDSFKLNYGLSGTDGENQFVSGSSTMIGNLYGGNNEGGFTENANVIINAGFTGDIYGGGDIANVSSTNVYINGGKINGVYGGSNRSSTYNNTNVVTTGGYIVTDIYGGGNEGVVEGSTSVNVLDTEVAGSIYAGGNGTTAVVKKNSEVTVQGNTIIGSESSITPNSGCLFGSGKAAATGISSNDDSIATVNLVGGKIYGNVYGGAHTSVVYGKTDVNIGTNVVQDSSLLESNMIVLGTIFGGGEANASGSENYDYSFISVTKGISVDIDGKDYSNHQHLFNISGSIFGSGNASSSSGTSEICISNLGSKSAPSKNLSIQRADVVTIDHSVMELVGTTDRTNEYSTIKYSFNRIDKLKLKNNSILLLQQNANMLKSLDSVVDKDGEEVKAKVVINHDTKKTTRNVDNRIYMLLDRNLNIATNEAATSYGKVSGMTFFGMYTTYDNGATSYGVYDQSLDYGDTADAGDLLNGGSYILGLHHTNQNIEEDGFYTNSLNHDYTEVVNKYIDPTPSNADYYLWTIGVESVNYSFKLTASKYSSLGTYELSMRDFAKGDTTFEVLGFNSEGLSKGVSLVDSNDVPKVANSEEEANKIMGLSIKTESTEWTSHETTKLLSKNNGSYTGSSTYKTDSQGISPSLIFYLYHAKDITLDQDLGSVVVTLQALVPTNEIEYDIKLITITVDLEAKSYDDGDCYDASITYNKKYEMPSATSVNITNKSQFSAYYSLYAKTSSFETFYGRNNDNYHVLTSSYALPVGTMITMLDYGGTSSTPTYYYYVIDQADYERAVNQLATENEVTYKLSNFIKMGSNSTNNTYSDQEANKKYFDYTWRDSGYKVSEEFVFIFDFKNSETSGDYLNNKILFELRNNEDRALISVLGIRQSLMNYNLYETSNVVLKETVNISNTNIYRNTFNNIAYSTKVDYDKTETSDKIIDTNYESISMGLNVFLYDSSGNQVSSSNLNGTILKINSTSYYVDSDGVFRIKLSEKVSNITRNITLLTDGTLASGSYTMKFVLFASNDGLHNDGSLKDSVVEIPIVVIGNDNILKVTGPDKNKIVNKNTSLNMLDEESNTYKIDYRSSLSKPNIRLSLLKRNTTSSTDNTYSEVDLSSLFINNLTVPSDTLTPLSTYEMLVTDSPEKTNELTLKLNSNLTTGTYKLLFKLYDQDHLVDEDIEYVIVKKGIN